MKISRSPLGIFSDINTEDSRPNASNPFAKLRIRIDIDGELQVIAGSAIYLAKSEWSWEQEERKFLNFIEIVIAS